jgi:hypothetical protein
MGGGKFSRPPSGFFDLLPAPPRAPPRCPRPGSGSGAPPRAGYATRPTPRPYPTTPAPVGKQDAYPLRPAPPTPPGQFPPGETARPVTLAPPAFFFGISLRVRSLCLYSRSVCNGGPARSLKSYALNFPRGKLTGDVELTHAPGTLPGATSRNPFLISIQ